MYAKNTPHLWFDKEAGEAAGFYTSLFPDSKVTNITKLHDTPSGHSELVSFKLEGQWFAAMDSAHEHNFAFNEAISFLVDCDTQEEINSCWERLSAVPEAEQCGWLKDKFGVSWQISSAALREMLT